MPGANKLEQLRSHSNDGQEQTIEGLDDVISASENSSSTTMIVSISTVNREDDAYPREALEQGTFLYLTTGC